MQDREAEIAKDREEIRQGDLAARPKDTKAHLIAGIIGCPIDTHGEVIGCECFESFDVIHGRVTRPRVAVGGIEPVTPLLEEFETRALAVPFEKRGPQLIGPALRKLADAPLDGRHRRRQIRGETTVHHHMEAGAPMRRQRRREAGLGSTECFDEQLLHPHSQRRVELISGDVDEAGHETPEDIAPHMELHIVAMPGVEDGERVGPQHVGGHLEQLVAGIVLEDRQEPARLVRIGREADVAEHVGDESADERHIDGPFSIGRVGQQADERPAPHDARDLVAAGPRHEHHGRAPMHERGE